MFRPYQLTHKVELPLLFTGTPEEKEQFIKKFGNNLKELGYEVNSERCGKENRWDNFFDGLEIIVACKDQAVISLTAKEFICGYHDVDLREIGFNEQATQDLSTALLAYLKSERERNEGPVKVKSNPKSYRDYYARRVGKIDKSIEILSKSMKQTETTT